MPRAAPTPCREHGCPTLCTGETKEFRSYCIQHGPAVKAKAEAATRRARARSLKNKSRKDRQTDDQNKLHSFYGRSVWRRVSQGYRAKHPLCEHCASNGVTKSADVVDHIEERSDGGADYDHANLQSLCHACHNQKTLIEKRRRSQTLSEPL